MADLEWLVLSRGCPARRGWLHQTRVDALARIARAALTDGSPCHLLFEDCTLLSLTPGFLGEGQAWGGIAEASEERLLVLLTLLSEGSQIPGACWNAPRPRWQCLTELITGRFGLLLDFRENGQPLLQCGGASSVLHEDAEVSVSEWPLPRTLCVIGGVRDALSGEERDLELACPELWAQRRTVSLGNVPELTSKCIKAVGALCRGGRFGCAVRRISAGGWEAPVQPDVSPPTILHTRPPMHIIVKTQMVLADFISCPMAAPLVVDVFRASGDSQRRTLLTILGAEGDGITLHKAGRCLAEADALYDLRCQLAVKRRMDLKKVLLDGQHLFRSDVRHLRVLHADESMPLLAPTCGPGEVTGLPAATAAVIFGSPTDSLVIGSTCAALGVGAYARAGTGGILRGPAYTCILHTAGLLLPAITEPPPAGLPQCPTERRLVRSPHAGARPAAIPGSGVQGPGGAQPHSWAQVVRGCFGECPKKGRLLSLEENGDASDTAPTLSTQAPSECSSLVDDWEERALDTMGASEARKLEGDSATPEPPQACLQDQSVTLKGSSGATRGRAAPKAEPTGEDGGAPGEVALEGAEVSLAEPARDGLQTVQMREEALPPPAAPGAAAEGREAETATSSAEGAGSRRPQSPGSWADVARSAAACAPCHLPGPSGPRLAGTPPWRRRQVQDAAAA